VLTAGESHLLSVIAEDLKDIRIPAYVVPQRDNGSFMGTCRLSYVFRQNKVINPHDTVYPLMIHRWSPISSERTVEKNSHTSVPIRKPLRGTRGSSLWAARRAPS